MMPAEPVGRAVQAGKEVVSAIVVDGHHLPVGLAKRADLIARQIVDSQPHPKIVRHGRASAADSNCGTIRLRDTVRNITWYCRRRRAETKAKKCIPNAPSPSSSAP